MNNIASRIIGSLCLLGIIVGIGWLLGSPIKANHEDKLITEARIAYEREDSLRQRQVTAKADIDAQIAEISAEKLARENQFQALAEEKAQLTAEIAELANRREAVITEMNQRAEKNRDAYIGRKFERFDPGNGKVYENVEVASVSDEGIKLRNELGLRTVRPEDVAENFQIRFRFGLLPGDKPLPVKPPQTEE